MLYAIGRRSSNNPNLIRLLLAPMDAGGRRAATPMLFASKEGAEAEIQGHTPGRYFLVPIPTLTIKGNRMELVEQKPELMANGSVKKTQNLTKNQKSKNDTKTEKSKVGSFYATYYGEVINRTETGYRCGNLTSPTRDGIRAAVRVRRASQRSWT